MKEIKNKCFGIKDNKIQSEISTSEGTKVSMDKWAKKLGYDGWIEIDIAFIVALTGLNYEELK